MRIALYESLSRAPAWLFFSPFIHLFHHLLILLQSFISLSAFSIANNQPLSWFDIIIMANPVVLLNLVHDMPDILIFLAYLASDTPNRFSFPYIMCIGLIWLLFGISAASVDNGRICQGNRNGYTC